MSQNTGVDNVEPPESKPDDFNASRVLIMIILVGIALAIFAGSRTMKPDQEPPVVVTEGPSVLYYAMVVIPWSLLAIVAFMFRKFVTASAINAFNNAAILLNAGFLDRAEIEFDVASKATTRNDVVQGYIAFQRGILNMRRGQNAEAISDLSAEIEKKWFKKLEPISQASLAADLILAQIFLGRTDDAQATLDKFPGSDVLQANHLLKMRFFLMVRKGELAEALEFARKDWRDIESMTTPYYFKLFRVIWAFALYKTDPNSSEIWEVLGAVRPFWKGQYEPLFQQWPEMLEFLREAKLTDEHAQS